MKKQLILLCILECALLAKAKVYDVRDYGAKGDGQNPYAR